MSVETDIVYSNLNLLLEDICTFLQNDCKTGNLSPESKLKVDSLIIRSKVQLQHISKLINENSDGAYVDMDPKKDTTAQNEDGEQMIYSSVESGDEAIDFAEFENIICPYAELPAAQLDEKAKKDYISWQTKILNFKFFRRIYAGVHNNWLLIYRTEKDSKPIEYLYLKNYNAEVIENKHAKSGSHFVLKSLIDKDKVYNFTTKHSKDTLQWIIKINLCHMSDVSPQQNDQNGENYDIVVNLNLGKIENGDDPNGNQTEGIYSEVEDYQDAKHKKDKREKEVLIRKNQEPLPPIPDLPKERNSNESDVSYDPVINPAEASSSISNSFSDPEEEEDIYDVVVVENRKFQNCDKNGRGSPVYKNDSIMIENNLELQRAQQTESLVQILSPNKQIPNEITFKKPVVKEKPKFMPLTKPIVDVKLSKRPLYNTKSPTKIIMRQAKNTDLA